MIQTSFRSILLLSLLLLWSGNRYILKAQDSTSNFLSQYLLSYQLSDDWQVYDDKYEGYVPYIPQRHGNSKSMGFWLHPSDFARQHLNFYASSGTYFFIDQKLAAYYPSDRWISYSLDSLRNVYGDETYFCTFYDDKQRLPLPQIFVGFYQSKSLKANAKAETRPDFPMMSRSSQDDKYVLILSFLLAVGGYAFLLNYSPKSFWSYFSLRSSLSSLAQKESNLINKTLNSYNFIFVFVLSIWMSIYFEVFFGAAQRFSAYSAQDTWFGNHWVLQVLLVLGINALIFLKYMGLVFFGLLLNIPKMTVRIHFFEYLRILGLYYTVAGVGIMVLIGGLEYLLGQEFIQVMLSFTLIFHVIQAFMMVYLIIKQLTFKSLYLFYYLCIAELVPILIGAKLLVFNIYD